MSDLEEEEKGPIGYLWHVTSGSLVRPRNLNQRYFTELVLNNNKPEDLQLIQFRFIPKNGAGHFGYIEHVCSQNVIGTKDHITNARDGTGLVLHTRRDYSALFGYDAYNKVIFRNTYSGNGKRIMWRPKHGADYPADGTPLVVNSNYDLSSQFFFGDVNGVPISPYPNPTISGNWKIIRSFVSPQIKRVVTETYKVGRSMNQTTMQQIAWSISVEYAKLLVKGNAKLSVDLSKTSNSTWEEEKEVSVEMTVVPGKSIYVWQFAYEFSQYGDNLIFMSNLVGDSNSKDKEPQDDS